MFRSNGVKGVGDKIVFLDPRELKPHVLNSELYDDREDPDFVGSIRNLGVREPLIINSNRVILGGHRRWRAALTLGLSKVPCVFQDFSNEQVAIVELNRQRVKTPRERHREAQVLRRELEPKARKQQGARTDLLSNLTRSPVKSTHVRDEIARKLAISSGKLYEIEFVYGHENLSPGVVKQLDRGDITVHGAYRKIKNKLRNTALQGDREPEKKPTETPSTSITIKEPARIIVDKRSRTVQIQFTMKIPVRVGIKTASAVGKNPSYAS